MGLQSLSVNVKKAEKTVVAILSRKWNPVNSISDENTPKQTERQNL